MSQDPMNNKTWRNKTWKEAFLASPGPRSLPEALVLSLKGVCMGTADVIPGVSGGTIALITGIYDRLLLAVGSADAAALKSLLRLDFKGLLSTMHVRFLVSLLAGIGAAILSCARLMNYLLHNHTVLTWSLFFGLIAASVLVVGRQVKRWPGPPAVSFPGGVAAAYVIVGLIPLSTPESLWFILLSGAVAICAMILPGISGAFILLILGKYEYITGTLKNPFLPHNMLVILVFGTGCVVGLVCFSRVLHFLLQRHHNATLAFLTGLMAGSMRKIWPWKEVMETKMLGGEEVIVRARNILPDQWDGQLVLALALVAAGWTAVTILERLSRRTHV